MHEDYEVDEDEEEALASPFINQFVEVARFVKKKLKIPRWYWDDEHPDSIEGKIDKGPVTCYLYVTLESGPEFVIKSRVVFRHEYWGDREEVKVTTNPGQIVFFCRKFMVKTLERYEFRSKEDTKPTVEWLAKYRKPLENLRYKWETECEHFRRGSVRGEPRYEVMNTLSAQWPNGKLPYASLTVTFEQGKPRKLTFTVLTYSERQAVSGISIGERVNFEPRKELVCHSLALPDISEELAFTLTRKIQRILNYADGKQRLQKQMDLWSTKYKADQTVQID